MQNKQILIRINQIWLSKMRQLQSKAFFLVQLYKLIKDDSKRKDDTKFWPDKFTHSLKSANIIYKYNKILPEIRNTG